MTIIVAFILEAFLFRMRYRKEHPEREKGELLCLQKKNVVDSLYTVPVAQRVNSIIYRINHCPLDDTKDFDPLKSTLH